MSGLEISIKTSGRRGVEQNNWNEKKWNSFAEAIRMRQVGKIVCRKAKGNDFYSFLQFIEK